MKPRAILAVVLVLLAVAPAAAQPAQEPLKNSQKLFVDEQQGYTPGYPMGNIAIGNPEIADFKVMAGRTDLLLFGKTPGRTALTIWDQNNVKRHEIMLIVTTREAEAIEKDLRDLVRDYPAVQVRTLGDSLVATGTVETQADFEAIAKIADAAGAQNLVRLTPRTGPVPRTNMPAPTGPGSGGGAPGTGGAPSNTFRVKYDIELLEASTAYTSGSYGSGIEPAGRAIFKGIVLTPVETEGEIYMSGAQIMPKEVATAQKKDNKKKGAPPAAPVETGIRLKLRPTTPTDDGQFMTYILVETNLPIGATKEVAPDLSIWRRARWEVSGLSGEPFGLAGAELLALPEIASPTSKLGKALSVAGTVGGLPGVSSAPGVGYVGAVPYYDRAKKTQLLVIFRPRVLGPGEM